MRLGIDPEFALINKSTGKGRSAHLFMGVGKDGTGAAEKIVTSETYEDETQVGAEMDRDGTNLEVRSLAPTACRDNIVPYVAECMRQTQLRLDEWGKGKYMLGTAATYELDLFSLKKEQKPPKDVTTWGCRPDIDAYALAPKQPDPPKGRVRYTGGHLHLSPITINENDIKEQAAVAVIHDFFIGLPLVAILGDHFAAGEAERRKVYGQAGSFRYTTKDDGRFEYRVPSSRVMLSPILLTWAMGVQRCFQEHLPFHKRYNYNTNRYEKPDNPYMNLLMEIQKVVKPSLVAEVINKHDVAGARELYPKVMPLMRGYSKDERALANKLAGGGGSTRNLYFYEKMVDLFVAANDEGLVWSDDVKHNWGLFENYYPKHHAYWAIGVASVGLTDESIFPQRPVIERFIPKQFIAKEPVYTHPLFGGKKHMHGSEGWLL